MTCGYQHVACWELNGSHLTCKNFIHIENENADDKKEEEDKEQEEEKEFKLPNFKEKEDKVKPNEEEKFVFMCMDYLNHRMGNAIEGDVYIGSNKGTIS